MLVQPATSPTQVKTDTSQQPRLPVPLRALAYHPSRNGVCAGESVDQEAFHRPAPSHIQQGSQLVAREPAASTHPTLQAFEQ